MLAERQFPRRTLNGMEINKLNVRVTDLGNACRRLSRFWWGGPPGPARVRPRVREDQGSAHGVRPTVYTRDATVAWRIGGLCDSSEGFDHRRSKSLIRRGLGEFLDGMA